MAANLPMQASAAIGAPPPGDDREVLSRLEAGRIGSREAGGTVRVRRSERGGCFLYGPYWELPEGGYRLGFDCRAEAVRWREQPVLGVEVIVLDRLQRAWRDYTADELAGRSGELLFEVPHEISLEGRNEGRFEFRFFHFGNADLRVEAVTLTRLGSRLDAHSPERRWRMLGRLETAASGRRGPDGAVVLRQRSRAGRVLYGGWPYLRLPGGGYRLSVSGRAGEPRDPSRPVLALEIVANSRWRGGAGGGAPASAPVRREFAAEALANGEASVDFAVPEAFSLEAGIKAPYELRLFHFGNAPLTIDAVDVTRIEAGPAAAASLPMPAVHPLGRKNIVIIGNCQAEIVWQAFNRVGSLAAMFDARYHFVRLPPSLHEFARRDLARCDILLVQDLRDWERFPLRDCLSAGREPVRFPGLRLASLWPFDGWNGPSDPEATRREGPNTRFPYLDGLLARLRTEIPDREQRFQAYRALEWPGIINYHRRYELERRELEAMDRRYGIAIGAFILDRFRSRRLFHTTVHPNREVFDMLMQFILRSIAASGRHKLPGRFEALLDDPQVPVHPKVAHDLGVSWADERTLYRNRGAALTWEEYVRLYIEHYG